ncbi:MAG: right-handed parallel beta-helix repeat-containing protein [Pseudomonadota bacterium]
MVATRYVKSTGSNTGTFTSKSTPAKTIAAALKAAAVGDTIEILDTATYLEPELLLTQAITLTSSYLVSNPTADPTAVGFDVKKLPTISADGVHRVLRVEGTPATRSSLGPIVLSGLHIAKGHSVHKSGDPGIGCGGGVVVVDADQVTVTRCAFTGNRTEAAPVKPWPEADRLALRQAVLDLLGDVFSSTAEAAINRLIELANKAIALLRLTPLKPVSRATVLTEVGKTFDGQVASGRANSAVTGQAFGGGLATVWASPTVSYCMFTDNTANGRGGALAVTGFGWPTVANCVFETNQTMQTGRSDGGAIGCEVAVPTKLGRDLFETDLVKFLVGKLSSVRATLASPLSSITISDLIAFATWVSNSAGPNPAIRGIKPMVLDAIDEQWKQLGDHALYYLVTTALSLNAWDAWEKSEIEAARKSVVTVRDCRISRNHAFDDGGGLYASVLSRVALSSTQITDNVAEDMGGGVRLTMGSDATISKCSFTGNASGIGGIRGHDKGGGLSARNVTLTVVDTVLGVASSSTPKAPVSTSNVSGDAPGGGFAYEAASEGALAGIPDLWSSILVQVFAVSKVSVSFGSGCVIGSNCAGFTARKSAVSAPQFAKGGGVFVVRGDFPDAPALDFTVAAAKGTILGNLALTAGYASRADPSLKVTTANEVSLQDLVAKKEYTENNWSTLIDSSGALKF